MSIHRALTLAGVSLVAISTPALAQAATAPASVQPSLPGAGANTGTADATIVVQARRRDEALQDVPLVVNAVTASTLQQDNIHQFQDITTVVPGLSLVPSSYGIGPSTSLRGVNHDVVVSADNGTVQYYINDAPVSSAIVFETLFDTSQIEVERGPQGTLRGRATPSGSIAITTTKPNLSEVGGYIDGTLASAATSNINAAVNVPIIKDMLAVRIAGVYDYTRGSRVTSLNNPRQPFGQTEAIRASARFEPTDYLKFGFTYMGVNHDVAYYNQAESFANVDPGFTPPTNIFASAPSYGTITLGDRKSVEAMQSTYQQHVKFYNWNAQLSFAGQNLIYVGSHQSIKLDADVSSDSGNVFPSLALQQNTHTVGSVTSHEIRLQNSARILGVFDYVAGYFHNGAPTVTNLTQTTAVELTTNYSPFPGYTLEVPIPSAYIPGGNPFATSTPIQVAPGKMTEESVFGNITAHLGERTEIAGGLRHIHDISTGGALYIAGNFATSGNDLDQSKTIYNATLRHRFTDNLMAYASTGSSFRPGVFAIGDFTSVPYSPNELAHLKLAPETSKSYEAGIKSTWLDKKILVNATYYHQDFTNYPFRSGGNGIYYINYSSTGAAQVGQVNFVSAVPVKVDGVEAEIAFRPSRHFSIDSAINWSHSKIGNALLACDGLPDGVVPTLAQLQAVLGSEHVGQCPGGGQSATFQPDWSATVTSEYATPLNSRMDAYLRGVFAWRGATQNDPNNPYDNVGSYGLLNLYTGLRDPAGAWQLTLYAKNITNVEKILTLNATPFGLSQTNVNIANGYSQSSVRTVSPYTGVTMTPPREFGVNLRIAFGSR